MKHLIIGGMLALAPMTLFAQKAGITQDQFMLEAENQFKRMDKDNNGYVKSSFGPIDEEEFMKRSAYSFKQMDTNEDGIISNEEKKQAKKNSEENFGESMELWMNETFK